MGVWDVGLKPTADLKIGCILLDLSFGLKTMNCRLFASVYCMLGSGERFRSVRFDKFERHQATAIRRIFKRSGAGRPDIAIARRRFF